MIVYYTVSERKLVYSLLPSFKWQNYMDTLHDDALEWHKQKLKVAGLLDCPFRSLVDQWHDDPKEWPEVQYKDIYHYLVHFPGKKVIDISVS